MSLTPQVVETVSTHAPGVLANFSEAEIQQSDRVRQVGERLDKGETEFRIEVVKLKLVMDQNDPDAAGGGSNSGSRFWNTARQGLHGSRLQEMIESGNRMTVTRWLKHNSAAKELLGSAVTRVTATEDSSERLPLEVALEKGISMRALETFGSLTDEAKPAAGLMLNTHDKVGQHTLEQINVLYRDYPELDQQLREGIKTGTLTSQQAIRNLMDSERQARAEADAARRALEQANNLQEAEAEEERLAEVAKSQPAAPAPPAPKTVAEKAAALVERKAPPRSYFESDAGKAKVTEIIGALPDGLGSLLTTLNTLEKELNTQFDHVESHADIRSFMAGYDRYFYSPSAAARKWGKGGRLDRMEKLRSKLLYLSGRIENYIRATTPDKETIYPD